MTSQHFDWSVAMSSLNKYYDKGTTQTREYKTHCVCSVFIFLHASSCHTCWHLIINRRTRRSTYSMPHCWTPLWWWSGLLEASVFVPVCCHFQSCLSSAPSETPHLKDGRITPENLEVTHRGKKGHSSTFNHSVIVYNTREDCPHLELVNLLSVSVSSS